LKVAAAVALLLAAQVSAAAAPFVVIAPGGGAIVRLVTDAPSCPPLTVDGADRTMSVRAGPVIMPPRTSNSGSAAIHPSAFPHTVCEAAVKLGARRASIGGMRVPLPPPIIRRIVLIGDTGCRLKAADKAWQACNDPAAWPFAQIAASAARWKPDLVIHVGDYHYRETSCPAGNTGCAGSPWGYGEDSWQADLLEPGVALFAAAPWAIARGNHEACNRAGQGWHRLLDPHPLIAGQDCIDAANDFAGNHAEPYVVDLGEGAQLIMLDIASLGSEPLGADDPRRARFIADATAVAAMAKPGKTSFLVGHYPFAAVRSTKAGGTEIGNPALSATFGNGTGVPALAGIAVVLSGHVHQFEQVSYGGALPSQIVTGFSGTLEDDPPAPTDVRGVHPVNGVPAIRSLLSIFGMQGFATIDRYGRNRWKLTVRDVRGQAHARCDIRGRRSRCVQVTSHS
jgi:hypothetical protein